MDSRNHAYGPYSPPGPDVTEQPDLEVVVHEQSELLPEVRPDDHASGGKEHITTQYPEHCSSPVPQGPQRPLEPALPDKGGRSKRFWFVVGAAVAIVVILAAVLGGVFGSRAAASQTGGDSASNTTAGSNPTTTSRPQLIRPGSNLTVTGWRKGDGGVVTYLVYQDPQGGLQYSKRDTTNTSAGINSTSWEPPVRLDTTANAETPLAASTIISDNWTQIEIFYAGYKTSLLGVNINEQATPKVNDDSVRGQQIVMGDNSSLTAYWPWTIYQDPTGVLFYERYTFDVGWDNNNTNILPITASRLAVVPMSTNFSRIAVKGGYAVFYQQPDGKLAVAIPDLDSLARDYPLSWTPTNLPSITPPKLAHMAGFSVARTQDPLQRVDTYLLYLDANDDINVVYTNSSGSQVEWKTVQPAALKGADRDTDIACLTMATSSSNAAGHDVPLEELEDATSCYFQKGGVVVEVRLVKDTGNWEVAGDVPIP